MGGKRTSERVVNLAAIRELLWNNPVCGEIVTYLSRHIHAVDTAPGIAEWWIKRDLGSTQEALVKLLRRGVVRSFLQGLTPVYAYTKNPSLRQRLARYVRALNNNHRPPSKKR